MSDKPVLNSIAELQEAGRKMFTEIGWPPPDANGQTIVPLFLDRHEIGAELHRELAEYGLLWVLFELWEISILADRNLLRGRPTIAMGQAFTPDKYEPDGSPH